MMRHTTVAAADDFTFYLALLNFFLLPNNALLHNKSQECSKTKNKKNRNITSTQQISSRLSSSSPALRSGC